MMASEFAEDTYKIEENDSWLIWAECLESPNQYTMLVSQLGNEGFRTRQFAAKQLTAAGADCFSQLTLTSNDPEIRHACFKLVNDWIKKRHVDLDFGGRVGAVSITENATMWNPWTKMHEDHPWKWEIDRLSKLEPQERTKLLKALKNLKDLDAAVGSKGAAEIDETFSKTPSIESEQLKRRETQSNEIILSPMEKLYALKRSLERFPAVFAEVNFRHLNNCRSNNSELQRDPYKVLKFLGEMARQEPSVIDNDIFIVKANAALSKVAGKTLLDTAGTIVKGQVKAADFRTFLNSLCEFRKNLGKHETKLDDEIKKDKSFALSDEGIKLDQLRTSAVLVMDGDQVFGGDGSLKPPTMDELIGRFGELIFDNQEIVHQRLFIETMSKLNIEDVDKILKYHKPGKSFAEDGKTLRAVKARIEEFRRQ